MILKILRFPDKRLRTVASEVVEFNSELKQIIKDMLETMYEANGAGLAATQVNIHKRIFTIDSSAEKNQPIVIINPEIIASEGEIISEEGCLSFPGVKVKVKRKEKVTLKYYDESGKEQIINEATGLLSRAIQHELDHINGKVFIDYFSPLKQKILLKKLKAPSTNE